MSWGTWLVELIHTQAHTQIYRQTQTRTNTEKHTHSKTNKQTYTQTNKQTYTQTQPQTNKNENTQDTTHTQTDTDTDTHTHGPSFACYNKCSILKWLPSSILPISPSRFHQIIKTWIFLKSTRKGLLKNAQNGFSRPLGNCLILCQTLEHFLKHPVHCLFDKNNNLYF